MSLVIEASGWPRPPGQKTSQLNRFYGGFQYEELSGGNVRILGDWMQDNIVTLPVKVSAGHGKTCTRKVQVHRKIAKMVEDLMEVVLDYQPNYAIHQLGGFCPRHKMHDPKRGLSLHSWGCALDINWKTNPVAKKLITDFPQDLIEIFEGAGWNWGGRWKGTKDAMHFQFTK